jgi:hypothetical protein
MDDEQKEWSSQLSRSLGVKEFLRFGCAFILWHLIGVALAVLLDVPIIGAAFLMAAVAYSAVATRWRPAYRLLRGILGNATMPAEPWPRSAVGIPKPPTPWWLFISGIWFWLLTLLLLFLAIRYLAR